MSIDEIILRRKVIVCAGSGGVGKTTFSASLAYKAAQMGQTALVLTVDPAKRLATTLNLDLTGRSLTEVEIEDKYPGRLEAGVIESKTVFDEFVKRHSANQDQVEKLFKNKLYQQLSTTLSGSQEFTALERLYECFESKKYDLIILDTPPTKHALDFLNAPQKISRLFEDSITRWFMNPEVFKGQSFIGKLFSKGTRTVLKSLEVLTGPEFIDNLIDFFESIQSLQSQLRDRSKNAGQLLKSNETGFVLVTGFDEAKLSEANYFKDQLAKQKYNLEAVVINRAYPELLKSKDDQVLAYEGPYKEVYSYFKEFSQYYSDRYKIYEQYKNNWQGETPIFRIPDFNQDVSSLKGLGGLIEEIVEFK